MSNVKTYVVSFELEDDPVVPFTPFELEQIKAHITKALEQGIDLGHQFMFLGTALPEVHVQEKNE